MLVSTQQTPDRGILQISVTSAANNAPVSGAVIDIAQTEEPDRILEEVNTDLSGQTEEIDLPAPPLEYSMVPNEPRPYAEYTLRITAPGYEPLVIQGTEVLPDAVALQSVRLRPIS